MNYEFGLALTPSSIKSNQVAKLIWIKANEAIRLANENTAADMQMAAVIQCWTNPTVS